MEVWFSNIERQALHRADVTSVLELNRKIKAFVTGWNDRCHPFAWIKTSPEILKKANRSTTSITGHWHRDDETSAPKVLPECEQQHQHRRQDGSNDQPRNEDKPGHDCAGDGDARVGRQSRQGHVSKNHGGDDARDNDDNSCGDGYGT